MASGPLGDAANAALARSALTGWPAELAQRLDQWAGCLQYWRSFAQLDRFARETGEPHLPTWKWFNREVGASGEVGIWHETYKVHPGAYECIYINMPRFGLAAAGMHTPIGSTAQSAARRIGATDVDEPALTPYANLRMAGTMSPAASENRPGPLCPQAAPE